MAEDWDQIRKEVGEAYASLYPPVGRDFQLIKKGPKSGPENRPVFGPDVLTPFMGMTSEFSHKERMGWTIAENDVAVSAVFSGTPEPTPNVGDRIRVDGVEYDIINMSRLAPGGVTVRWRIQVRGHGA